MLMVSQVRITTLTTQINFVRQGVDLLYSLRYNNSDADRPPEITRRVFLLSKPKPAYYGILPANVRYDKSLVPMARILYTEITALANATGECTAGNKYFAELYEVASTTVSEWISSLRDAGYIIVNVNRESGNKRTIRLPDPIQQKPKTSSGKAEDPSSGKAEENNTSNNNIAPKLRTAASKIHQTYLMYFFIGKDRYNSMTREERAAAIQAEGRRHYRLTSKKESKIVARLRECDGDPQPIIKAVIGFGTSEFHLGDNDRNWKADLIEYICRDYETIEKGVGLYEKQKNSSDPWDKL